jgi:hypothetical protein
VSLCGAPCRASKPPRLKAPSPFHPPTLNIFFLLCLAPPSILLSPPPPALFSFDYTGTGGAGWPSNPTGFPPQPFIFTSGGTVLAMDELAPNALFSIDSIAPANTAWSTCAFGVGSCSNAKPIVSNYGTRYGQRFLSWGSSIFMWGGITAPTDGSTPQFRTDMYAFELTSTLNNAANSGWMTVSPPNPSNGPLPNWPNGRVSPSWTGFTVGAFLFGGISTTDGSPPWPACFQGLSPSNPAPSNCVFDNNMWGFFPSSVDWTTGAAYGASSWTLFNAAGAYGGPIPAGRHNHIAGSLGDQLFVYGGITATGPVQASDALWTYNLVSQTWAPIRNSPAQPPAGDGYWPTGTFVARHFYVWNENFGPGFNGPSLGGQLWRWSPAAFTPSPCCGGGGGGGGNDSSTATGHTWGIVIGILIGCVSSHHLTPRKQPPLPPIKKKEKKEEVPLTHSTHHATPQHTP